MHRAGLGAASEQGLCHVAAEVLWCQEEQLRAGEAEQEGGSPNFLIPLTLMWRNKPKPSCDRSPVRLSPSQLSVFGGSGCSLLALLCPGCEEQLGLSRVWERLGRIRKTRSSCLLSCFVLSISVANLLLLEAIKKHQKTKTNPLQEKKKYCRVFLCVL